MSRRVMRTIRALKTETLALIRVLDNGNPEYVPVVDALEDVHHRILDLQATIQAIETRDAYLEGMAAGVGLGKQP